MSDDKTIQDISMYERMNVPYPTQEEATAALDAFIDDVVALREKHRIGSFVICASVSGHVCPTATMLSRGEMAMAAILATRLYRRYAAPLLQQLNPTEVDEG